MSIAYITGGQYVPMVNAKLLAQVIIGGVREEISLERLMQDAQEDINREIEQAETEGADEHEVTERVNRLLLKKNVRVKQMENLGGTTSSVARDSYSKCADMSELRRQYKVEEPPEPAHHSETTHYRRRTRESARRIAASGGRDRDLDDDHDHPDTVGGGSEETGGTPSRSAAAAPEMNYDLKENEAVSMAQTERIVQRMRNRR